MEAVSVCPGEVVAVGTPFLKGLLNAGLEMKIVDARMGAEDDGRRIPHARSLALDASEQEIADIAGPPEGLVVLYEGGQKCASSGKLAQRLTALGYRNVYLYRDGIDGWVRSGEVTEYEINLANQLQMTEGTAA